MTAENVPYHPDPLLNKIVKRLWLKDLNYIVGIIGSYGSGKTCAGLWVCKEVDPTFNISRVVYSAEEFLKLLLDEGEKKLEKGSAILYEEASVSVRNRLWYTKTNLAISAAVDTIRDRNFLLVFTMPFKKNIDKNIRSGFHAVIRMVGEPDRKRGVSTGKYRLVSVDELYGNTDKPWYPRVNAEGIYGAGKLDEIVIPRCDVELEMQTKKKKDQFRKDYFSNALKNIERLGVGDLRNMETSLKEIPQIDLYETF